MSLPLDSTRTDKRMRLLRAIDDAMTMSVSVLIVVTMFIEGYVPSLDAD